MPLSTLELRPKIDYSQNTYGDQKYNVMHLISLYNQDPSHLPWQQSNGRTQMTKVHSIKLPTLNSQGFANQSGSFYASSSQPRLNLPSVVRGMAHSTLVPFSSYGKPTCGYFFTRTTENRKMRTGIPPKFGYLNVTAPRMR